MSDTQDAAVGVTERRGGEKSAGVGNHTGGGEPRPHTAPAARTTPHGLHVTRDDGQNAFVDELLPCPFCGAEQGLRGPYVQVGPVGYYGDVDARVVCGRCHVATPRASSALALRADAAGASERDLAIELAVGAWNTRAGERR